MVERLKAAIEKARERREAQDAASAPAAPAAPRRASDAPEAASWSAIPEARLDLDRMTRERVIAHQRSAPASIAFDVLRTRLLKVCSDRGWRRIGVTSPDKGCGKTVVTANLGFSLARLPTSRTIVMDLDLKVPALAQRLGAVTDRRMADLLAGRVSHREFLERVGETIAFGFNATREKGSAELVRSAEAGAALARMIDDLRPTMVLYDLPPLLVSDDVLGFLDSLDAVILIAAAGQTLAPQIEECERLLADNTNLLGVVLNKADDDPETYQYDQAAV